MDFTGLGPAAKALVNRVSDAVGGAFRPWQIERVAKAEARAKVISTAGDVAADQLRARAERRILYEETEKQKNIEAITALAAQKLPAGATPDSIEKDWLIAFLDKTKLVSDGRMQEIWAKILAGEANSAGTFSKRALHVVSTLEKKEAEIFEKLLGFVWEVEDRLTPLVFDASDPIYRGNGINFEALKHLEAAGLIHFEGMAGYNFSGFESGPKMRYGDKVFVITSDLKPDSKIGVGKVIFTDIGNQLLRVCTRAVVEGFDGYVQEKMKEKGIVLSAIV